MMCHRPALTSLKPCTGRSSSNDRRFSVGSSGHTATNMRTSQSALCLPDAGKGDEPHSVATCKGCPACQTRPMDESRVGRGELRAILFDLGGVIIDIDFKRAFHRWAARASCDPCRS